MLTDDWDLWKVAADGTGGENLTVNGKTDGIRYAPFIQFEPEPRTGHRFRQARVRRHLRRMDEEERLRQMGPGQDGRDTVGLARRSHLRIDQGPQRRSLCVFARNLRRLPGFLPHQRDAEGREEGDDDQPAAGQLRLVQRARAGRLQRHRRQEDAGRPVSARELRAGQEVPDDRLHLREALAGTASIPRRPRLAEAASIKRCTRQTAMRCSPRTSLIG